VVISFVARAWLPGYEDRWESPLAQVFDCGVEIQHVRTPRPGVARFGQLLLGDPETSEPLATLAGVVFETCDDRDRMTIARAEFNGAMGKEVSARIERLLRSGTRDTQLTINELVIATTNSIQSLPDVRGQLSTHAAGCRILAWSGEADRGFRILIERNRQLDPPATLISFQTGVEPLPCATLAFWDGFDQLGPQAMFHGRVDIVASRDTVAGTLSGRFSQLADAASPVEIRELRWDGVHSRPVDALFAHLQPSTASTPSGDVAWELRPLKYR
jgi:hypothetical protein